MERLVFRRRHACRIALIEFQCVRNPQLLAQPHDTVGLRNAKVVNGQHKDFPVAPKKLPKKLQREMQKLIERAALIIGEFFTVHKPVTPV